MRQRANERRNVGGSGRAGGGIIGVQSGQNEGSSSGHVNHTSPVRNAGAGTHFHPRKRAHHSHSRVQPLSREQLLGIGASILLSFSIVISAVWFLHLIAPFAVNGLRKILSFQYLSKAMKPTPKMLVLEKILADSFENDYFNLKPALVSSNITFEDLSTMKQWLDTVYANNKISIYPVSSLIEQLSTNDDECSTWSFGNPNLIDDTSITIAEYRQKRSPTSSYNFPVFTDKSVLDSMPLLNKYLKVPENFSLTRGKPLRPALSKAAVGSTSWFGRLYSQAKEKLPTGKANQVKKLRSVTPVFIEGKDYSLSIILKNRGMPFHQLDNSWNLLISGQIKWVLYHPDDLPRIGFDPAESLENWLRRDYGTLWNSQMPYEVIQESGQILYIPEGWYRAYASRTAESVLVTQTRSFCDDMHGPSSLCDFREGMKRKRHSDLKSSAMFLQQALASSPDYKTFLNLGSVQQQLNDIVGAEESFKQAISRNYRNPEGYIRLLGMYEKILANGEVEQLENAPDVSSILELAKNLNISESNEQMQYYLVKYS
jgi:hypothetical protein